MSTIETLLELKSRLDELSSLVKKIDELVLILSPKPKKEKKEGSEKKPRKPKIVIPNEVIEVPSV